MIPVSFIFVLRFYLDSVGLNKIAAITGVAQLIGALIGAFWLIPTFGPNGRAWTPFSTWLVPAIYLIIVCLITSKKVFQNKPQDL